MQHYECITENNFDLAGNPGSKGGDNSPSPLPRARNTGSNFFGLVSQWQARSRGRSPRQPNAGSIPVQSSSLCPGRFSKGFLFTFPLGEGPTRTVPRRLSTSGAGAVSFFRVPIACVEGVRSQAEYEGSPLGNVFSSPTALFNTSSQPGLVFEIIPGAGNLLGEGFL